MNEEILLERIQRIESAIYRLEAMMRTIIRDMNHIPDAPQAPNLSVIKTTH
jgi:hypothetical protein